MVCAGRVFVKEYLMIFWDIFFLFLHKNICFYYSLNGFYQGTSTEYHNIDFMEELRNITKTCLYNFDPLKPHFYIVKLGFKGVYIIFLIFAKKHRLWVLIRTASLRQF